MSSEDKIVTLLSGDFALGDGVTWVYEGETASSYLENPEQYDGFVNCLRMVGRTWRDINVGEDSDYDEAESWGDNFRDDAWNTELANVLLSLDEAGLEYKVSESEE